MTIAILLAGCSARPPAGPPEPTATVTAAGETRAVETVNADAADDPAIWRNPADPAASLIVGTDKKAGLWVYGLDGAPKHFVNAGNVNNVDLRADVSVAGVPTILVAASDRGDLKRAMIALFRLDPATGRLTALGKVAAGAGEAYGLCLYTRGAETQAFMVVKDGTINQVALDLGGAVPAGRIVRTMKLATQSEGCVVDERSGRLYVGEENVGVWRFDAGPDGATAATAVARVDRRRLVADVEGVALAPVGARGGWLVVSSQGDSAYSLYRLEDDAYVGRFRIAAGRVGATSETDGIELATGAFGADYPDGLFVAQDGDNRPAAQNFKLVSWAEVRRALNLPYDARWRFWPLPDREG